MNTKDPKGYWFGSGTYEDLADQLRSLIPNNGPVKGKENSQLEKLRRAINAYYDIFNNGGGNRDRDILTIFGLRRHETRSAGTAYLFSMTEPVMDRLILAAAKEQKLDVFEAAPLGLA